METYESKLISEVVKRMNESKNVHELNQLYNDAEKILFSTYEALFQQLIKQQYLN